MKISKIYYLNLKSNTDRMYFMESQLSKIKIPYERFAATYIESGGTYNRIFQVS